MAKHHGFSKKTEEEQEKILKDLFDIAPRLISSRDPKNFREKFYLDQKGPRLQQIPPNKQLCQPVSPTNLTTSASSSPGSSLSPAPTSTVIPITTQSASLIQDVVSPQISSDSTLVSLTVSPHEVTNVSIHHVKDLIQIFHQLLQQVIKSLALIQTSQWQQKVKKVAMKLMRQKIQMEVAPVQVFNLLFFQQDLRLKNSGYKTKDL
jgi:hypothetical protein